MTGVGPGLPSPEPGPELPSNRKGAFDWMEIQGCVHGRITSGGTRAAGEGAEPAESSVWNDFSDTLHPASFCTIATYSLANLIRASCALALSALRLIVRP